ncbi:MAG: flagellar biosynthetic protein FliR [Phycisphaerales bacterium]
MSQAASLAPLGLAACRVAGMATFAPALAAATVPVRLRVALAVALAVVALPVAVQSPLPEAALAEPWRLAPAALLEFALGGVIGFLAMLPVAAFRTAGSLAGVQMGLGFGALYDPSTGGEEAGDPLEQLLALAGIALFVAVGGLDAVALATLRSFDYVTLGAWSPGSGLVSTVAGALLAASELSLRVAMPVTAVLVAEALVSGFLARTVPGLGPVVLGFPVRVAVGLLALAAGAAAMHSAMQGAVGALLDRIHAAVAGGGA